MSINMSPTREKYPLSEKKIIKKTLTSIITKFISILFLLISFEVIFVTYFRISIFINMPDNISNFFLSYLLLLLLLLMIFLLTFFYQKWYFDVYFYDAQENYLVIRKGPIAPKEITIPWERIQDVYVDQDVFDRIFGLYDVHISTATIMSGREAHIDGVEKEAAEGLRALLLEKVKDRISRL